MFTRCNQVPYMQIRDIPGVNIIGRKVSIVSINGSGGSGGLLRGFPWWSTLRKFLGSKEHPDWLKIDLNAVEILLSKTINTKKTNVNESTHIEC